LLYYTPSILIGRYRLLLLQYIEVNYEEKGERDKEQVEVGSSMSVT